MTLLEIAGVLVVAGVLLGTCWFATATRYQQQAFVAWTRAVFITGAVTLVSVLPAVGFRWAERLNGHLLGYRDFEDDPSLSEDPQGDDEWEKWKRLSHQEARALLLAWLPKQPNPLRLVADKQVALTVTRVGTEWCVVAMEELMSGWRAPDPVMYRLVYNLHDDTLVAGSEPKEQHNPASTDTTSLQTGIPGGLLLPDDLPVLARRLTNPDLPVLWLLLQRALPRNQ